MLRQLHAGSVLGCSAARPPATMLLLVSCCLPTAAVRPAGTVAYADTASPWAHIGTRGCRLPTSNNCTLETVELPTAWVYCRQGREKMASSASCQPLCSWAVSNLKLVSCGVCHTTPDGGSQQRVQRESEGLCGGGARYDTTPKGVGDRRMARRRRRCGLRPGAAGAPTAPGARA